MTNQNNNSNLYEKLRNILEQYKLKTIEIKKVNLNHYEKEGKRYYFIKTQIHPKIVEILNLENKKLLLILCYFD